jgi:hypothetical protein
MYAGKKTKEDIYTVTYVCPEPEPISKIIRGLYHGVVEIWQTNPSYPLPALAAKRL